MKFKKIAAAVLAAAVLAATPATVSLFSPFSVTANAEDVLTEGDYEYSVNADGESVTITKYTGTEAEVEIPATLGGKAVTVIGNMAFHICQQLVSVTIPKGVTAIDSMAFYGCSSLINVTIPNGVTSIGGNAFEYCTSITSITIPDSVTSIEYVAFGNCTSLTSVTIPNSVTSIGNGAFRKCSLLTSIIIPNSLKTINYNTFSDCTSLTGVTIPDSVQYIGSSAFQNCTSLTDVVLPNSVMCISNSAFKNCTSLVSVTIPDRVTQIGDGAFLACDLLETIYYGGTKEKWEAIEIDANNECLTTAEIKFTESNTDESEVPQPGDTFVDGDYECSVNEDGESVTLEGYIGSDTTVVVPSTLGGKKVTIIGGQAFSHRGIKSITIPEGVEKIGAYTFYDNGSLTEINLPNSIKSIGPEAFQHCHSLTRIRIPKNLENYEGSYGCISLEEFTIDEDNPNLSVVDGVLFNKGKTVLCSFPAGKKLDSYTIPSSVTKIGYGAFKDYPLTSLTIPTSVVSIERYAFETDLLDDQFHKVKFLKDVYYEGSESQWEKINIVETGNSMLLDATIHYAKEDEEESDTSSEPTTSDTSEPATSKPETSEPETSDPITSEPETSEPTTSEPITSEPVTSEPETSEPTTSEPETSEPETSEPETSDTSEPTTSDTSKPTTSDTSEPTSSETHEPATSDTSEPTSSGTSDPTDPDIYDEKYDITTDVETSPDAAGIPDDERVKSVTINATNWINKGEINLDEVKVKVREIYDEEGLKRAEAALGKILDGNKYNLLDLTLLYNGEDYSNGYEGLIQVKFKIPNGHKNKTISCYRITEVDGKSVKELIPGTQTEDYYIIYLEHFSLYALVAADDPDNGNEPENSETSSPESPAVSDSDTTTAPSDTTSGTPNPPTGIALSMVPTALVAGAVIAFSKKRK